MKTFKQFLNEGLGHMIPHDDSPEAAKDYNTSIKHATEHGYQPISHSDFGISLRHPEGHEIVIHPASRLWPGKSAWSHKPKGEHVWGGKYGNASLKQHLQKFHGN